MSDYISSPCQLDESVPKRSVELTTDLDDNLIQADEGLSHQKGEALVQKWALESNVDLSSASEMEIFTNQTNKLAGGDF